MSEQNEPDPNPGFSGGTGGGTGGAGGGGTGPGTGGIADPAPNTGSAGGVVNDDARWKNVPTRFWWVPFAVGLVVLAGYAMFLGYMRRHVGAGEPQWSRLVYLFGSVEALAFAAAGFFFGREVNRARAEAAENRAETETRRAAGAERQAASANARGQVLSAALQSLADGAGEPQAAGLREIGSAAPDARPQLRELARLADNWFPRGW